MSSEAPMRRSGVLLTGLFSEETVLSVIGYKPRPGEVFIVSYPKCGTTWLQHIIYNIFTDAQPVLDKLDFILRMPFLERHGVEAAVYGRKPGALKTHLQFEKNPYSPDAKYIYITRNPYDCCVSFYYHYKYIPIFNFANGTFDEFFEMFLDGAVVFGDYFDHLMSWYPHRNDPNVLFLTYEGLKSNTKDGIMRIAEFLGSEYANRLKEDQELFNRVCEASSLDRMKEKVNALRRTSWKVDSSQFENVDPHLLNGLKKESEFWATPMTGDFVRKGMVGDWRNHFSPDQLRRLKEHVLKRTKGSDVMNLWENEELP